MYIHSPQMHVENFPGIRMMAHKWLQRISGYWGNPIYESNDERYKLLVHRTDNIIVQMWFTWVTGFTIYPNSYLLGECTGVNIFLLSLSYPTEYIVKNSTWQNEGNGNTMETVQRVILCEVQWKKIRMKDVAYF